MKFNWMKLQSPTGDKQILPLRHHYLRGHFGLVHLPRSLSDTLISLNEIRQSGKAFVLFRHKNECHKGDLKTH